MVLEKMIKNYILSYPDENVPHRMLEYLGNSDCFSNNNFKGHFTGSAWIVSPDKSQILMHHHKKLDKWLQVGGHADGEEYLLKVAIREAREESGIQNFIISDEAIFDVDIHEFPERGGQPSHMHYDVRFFLEACPLRDNIVVSDESYDVVWVSLDSIIKLNPEISIQRMVQKTLLIKNN